MTRSIHQPALKTLGCPVHSDFACDFHTHTPMPVNKAHPRHLRMFAKIEPQSASQNSAMQTSAPNPLHPPVNSPHSIENSEDTGAGFSLTLQMKRVKTQSFFDTF
jgi:hypothetical protein